MDPFTAFTVLSAGSSALEGFAGNAQNMNEAARADSEARLADTQALQRDTAARDELTRYLSTVTSARSANGLSLKSPNARLLEGEAISVSDSDRLRQRADDRQRAANFRASAKSYRKAGRMSLVTGVVSAGTSVAKYKAYQG